jgi:glycerol dehydrogenase
MIKIIGFPGRYIQGPNAVQHLPNLLKEFSLSRPIALMDDLVRTTIGDVLLNPLSAAGIDTHLIRFLGECSSQAIERLTLETEKIQADVVIGYGGGKTIDAAKGIAKARNLKLIIVPTIASNDSPTSRLIVLYDDQHRVLRVDRMIGNPDVVLVDTAIIARAPARFFAAGLGDALSKKFEATQCHLANGMNFFGTQSLSTARLLAERCYDTILEFGLPALRQIQEYGTPNDSVELAVEASVLLSGLGFESGGLSLSHALTRGFSSHPAMSTFLHGETVAFGSIVQLVAEDRPRFEVQTHIDFCHSLGLPITLAQLGAPNATDTEIMQMAILTAAAPYIGNLTPPADAQRIAMCIRQADEMGRVIVR